MTGSQLVAVALPTSAGPTSVEIAALCRRRPVAGRGMQGDQEAIQNADDYYDRALARAELAVVVACREAVEADARAAHRAVAS